MAEMPVCKITYTEHCPHCTQLELENTRLRFQLEIANRASAHLLQMQNDRVIRELGRPEADEGTTCSDCGHEAELNSRGRCYRCERDLWERENGPSGDRAWFNRDKIAARREMDHAAQDAYREMIGRV